MGSVILCFFVGQDGGFSKWGIPKIDSLLPRMINIGWFRGPVFWETSRCQFYYTPDVFPSSFQLIYWLTQSQVPTHTTQTQHTHKAHVSTSFQQIMDLSWVCWVYWCPVNITATLVVDIQAVKNNTLSSGRSALDDGCFSLSLLCYNRFNCRLKPDDII